MNMIVCVKQVIDPEAPPASFKINPAANAVVPPQGVSPVLDPYGEYAVEAALKVKDAKGGKITAISLGNNMLRDVVKKPLSMGADELILLEDEAFTDGDSWSNAQALAAAIKEAGELCNSKCCDGSGVLVRTKCGEAARAFDGKKDKNDPGTPKKWCDYKLTVPCN